MNISINCPSYRRPVVETLDYLPFCKVWVDPKEHEDYVKANPASAQIIKCAPGVQGNLCRVRNYILKEEFKAGADVVLLIDDDLKGVYYFEAEGAFGYKKNLVATEDFLAFLEKHSIMAQDIGARLWGINVSQDPQNYMQYTPINTAAYIGGPFQCFMKGNECFYDERLPLKEDYDMTLQQLNRYRVVLRFNKFFYAVRQAEQTGGCATYRNYEREQQQFEALQRKWGSRIVRRDERDRSNKLKCEKVRQDFNPILKVPIKGV